MYFINFRLRKQKTATLRAFYFTPALRAEGSVRSSDSVPSIYLWLYSPLLDLEFLDLFTQSVGFLGRGISPSQGSYRTAQTHRHPYLQLDSNPRSKCLSGRRQFMTYTAQSPWSTRSFSALTNHEQQVSTPALRAMTLWEDHNILIHVTTHNTRWEFNGKSHHLLHKLSYYYYFALLSPVFLSGRKCYRMIRRGQRSTPAPMNNTHKQSMVNCLLYIFWRIDPLLGNDSVNTFPRK
jgi:hypothetical protein